LKLRNIKSSRANTIKECANLAARMVYESARQYFPSIAHILLAGFDKQGTHLYELYADGSLNEVKDYVSSGSGSPMVYGILENSFKDSVSVKDAEDLAVKAISASMQRDSFSGNGIDVMVISRDSIRKTVQKKVSGIPV
jgi:proteasome beta subunit